MDSVGLGYFCCMSQSTKSVSMIEANASENAVHSTTRQKMSQTWFASQIGPMARAIERRGAPARGPVASKSKTPRIGCAEEPPACNGIPGFEVHDRIPQPSTVGDPPRTSWGVEASDPETACRFSRDPTGKIGRAHV